MARNRVFFPQTALDEWVADETIDLSVDELVIRPEGRRYRIAEAARVLAEVTGGADAYELIGRVKTVGFLEGLGAELLGNSMIIGDNAYEVVRGFLGVPIGSFEEHVASVRGAQLEQIASENDEALLARYLMHNLE